MTSRSLLLLYLLNTYSCHLEGLIPQYYIVGFIRYYDKYGKKQTNEQSKKQVGRGRYLSCQAWPLALKKMQYSSDTKMFLFTLSETCQMNDILCKDQRRSCIRCSDTVLQRCNYRSLHTKIWKKGKLRLRLFIGKQCEKARFRKLFVLIYTYNEMFLKSVNYLLHERCLTTERTAAEEINLWLAVSSPDKTKCIECIVSF